MLYKFKSKASADVIMLAAGGDQVLRLMGREPAPKGILECADMPAAMLAIERAVAADEAERQQAEAEAQAKGDDSPAKGQGVSLRQRVWPLLEMMKRSARAEQPIVWGV